MYPTYYNAEDCLVASDYEESSCSYSPFNDDEYNDNRKSIYSDDDGDNIIYESENEPPNLSISKMDNGNKYDIV